MPEESLVARLREYADVTADMRSLPLLREAADALERAEKERDEMQERCANVAERLSLKAPDRDAEDSIFAYCCGYDQAAGSIAIAIRALSPSTKDETK